MCVGSLDHLDNCKSWSYKDILVTNHFAIFDGRLDCLINFYLGHTQVPYKTSLVKLRPVVSMMSS